jgi:hypothetical protein
MDWEKQRTRWLRHRVKILAAAGFLSLAAAGIFWMYRPRVVCRFCTRTTKDTTRGVQTRGAVGTVCGREWGTNNGPLTTQVHAYPDVSEFITVEECSAPVPGPQQLLY